VRHGVLNGIYAHHKHAPSKEFEVNKAIPPSRCASRKLTIITECVIWKEAMKNH
jgi:hypothetical protein